MLTAAIERPAEKFGLTKMFLRRRYWIMPKVQGKFVAWMVASSAIIATVVAWAVLLLVWAPLRDQIVWAQANADADVIFAQAVTRIFLTTGLMIVIFGAFSFLLGLFISHRVAGPLYRIGRVAGRAADQRYSERVTLRKRDYIHDFAEEFNRMMHRFETEHVAHQETLRTMDERLSAIAEQLRCGSMADTDVKQRIEESLEILRDCSACENLESDSEV